MKTPVLKSLYTEFTGPQACNFVKRASNTGAFLNTSDSCFWYGNQSTIIREITGSKFQGQHATQFNFCRYDGLCPASKTEIHRRCFSQNSAKF